MEQRQLFSTTLAPTRLTYDHTVLKAASTSTTVEGYTPTQIAHAYGFDQISYSNGAVAGNGAGQTIAIVDAFNDPSINADLKVFDQQFGLSNASLKIVNQSGGSNLPGTDPGWAGEISLDVEWAHAMAQGANILLVEANSASIDDLLAAVNYARNAAGVSVVSMSWGGSEFVNYSGGESESQLALDNTFTTPANHASVTFIASAGDSGFSDGVQWPASSPNVVAVGGTSLTTSDSSGAYAGEGAWRGFQEGTSGGFSQYETEPAYQQTAQQSGARSTPDVGYNADPNTGFAVYDSIAYQGVVGWQEVGGTSAGAPQWAALVAIADQGRAISGLSTLDGVSQTLPALYSVYSAPATAGYTTYTSYFNDIGDDGYGYTTGLGSLKAAAVDALLTGATTTGTTTPTQPASPLSIAYTSTFASSVLTGSTGTATVRLTNVSGAKFSGPVSITLDASTDPSASSGATALTTVTLKKITLVAGASKTVKIKFDYGSSLAAGNYYLVASVSATATNDASAQVASPASITIGAASVDLVTQFAQSEPLAVVPGKHETAHVIVTNSGNVAAQGTFSLNLFASTDPNAATDELLLRTLKSRHLDLRPGQSLSLAVSFSAPDRLAAGAYSLIATSTSATSPADTNAANDTATLATR